MSELNLVERETAVLRGLEQLAADRARDELETEKANRLRREDERRRYDSHKTRITTTARTNTSETRAKFESVRASIEETAARECQAVEQEYAEAKKTAIAKGQASRAGAKKRLEETRWQALAVFEAGKDGVIKQFKQHEKEIATLDEQRDLLTATAQPVLQRTRRFKPRNQPESSEPVNTDEPLAALHQTLKEIEELRIAAEQLLLPKLLQPQMLIFLALVVGGGLAYPLGTRLGWGPGCGIAAGLGVVAAVGAYFGLRGPARSQVGAVRPRLTRALNDAEALVEASKQWAKARMEQGKADVEERRQREASAAELKFQKACEEYDARRDLALEEAEAAYPPRIQAISDRRDAARKEAEEFYPRRLAEIQAWFQAETQKLEDSHAAANETNDTLYQNAWAALIERWRVGLAQAEAHATSVNTETSRLFLDWHHADINAWEPPSAVPPALQFGRFRVDLAEIPQGLPTDERLKDQGPTRHDLPALLPFPHQGSVLIKAADAGKAEAVRLLQSLMLRYLTSLPPGKVRFTIIDSVGLGENFAAFMHLSDYHELLVTNRIWTETPHIEQRLADLSAHMENVIQKYLRNEFETIEEYNAFAGEVAEPFRVLVVANFPANFSEQAARRLVSIATTGSRCGVYTLLSIDSKLTLPTGVQLKELEPHCVNFHWRDGKLAWREATFGKLPLTYDAPPETERFSRIMHKVGELARNANRVEVPFEFIAPTPDQYWTFDSRSGIDVPLGRAGATKLQHLKLGKGTSQHVLIAGKTGSGKSTLLHALITNAALRYSPDELELYLIDFKKGVEFKVYAAMELPHARVIAVESEREFGLSVLQRLDVELKNRGDRFRDLGVQDLNGFREATGGKEPMPRVLFIVDEFQEFFVEDDKIAQEVALLLDRLVRQGRAFGIHVHLGSQSLGGAYSLARSTIGQMAVRIALQCSESDAHLILSEENSAARLLTRPGEAIYNDANGLVEGNNFFQVVWLSDERREDYLRQIRDLARAQHRPPASQIVFEGNLPAIPSKNHLLATLLDVEVWGQPPKADTAWLGEAIAIKDPTAAVFRPQSGANLLIVGQNDQMALAMFEMAIIALGAERDPANVRFYLFDGSPVDSPLAGRLGRLSSVVPHPSSEVNARSLAASITEIAREVERRQSSLSGDEPTIYLFIFDIQRFRDLRKQDDDFGFSRYGEEAKAAPPSRLFGNILKDGPALGIHTLVWCDSLNNLNRTFDRQTLREFELRVLFQMSANDSSTLIDAPVASRLGPNRALFFSEEEGRLEKFRPYGLPDDAWLDALRTKFHNRPQPEPRPLPEPTNGHEPTANERAEESATHEFGSGFKAFES